MGDLAEQRELAFVLQATSWSGADFHKVANVCAECGEPADLSESGKCQWCDIDEVDKEEASRHSLLSLTLAHGIDEGIPLAFDRMEPRGRLTAEWRRPLEYKCGEEIKPGDRVLFHGNPAEVELVSCNPYDSNPAAAWHVKRYGSGVCEDGETRLEHRQSLALPGFAG